VCNHTDTRMALTGNTLGQVWLVQVTHRAKEAYTRKTLVHGPSKSQQHSIEMEEPIIIGPVCYKCGTELGIIYW